MIWRHILRYFIHKAESAGRLIYPIYYIGVAISAFFFQRSLGSQSGGECYTNNSVIPEMCGRNNTYVRSLTSVMVKPGEHIESQGNGYSGSRLILRPPIASDGITELVCKSMPYRYVTNGIWYKLLSSITTLTINKLTK